jgi:hypothetical protein
LAVRGYKINREQAANAQPRIALAAIRSFVPQRFHGVHVGGADGGVDAKDDSHQSRDAERQQRRPEGDDGLHAGGERLNAARKTLEAIEAPDYPQQLTGTIGAEPVEAYLL